MKVPEIDAAIGECRRHLNDTESHGTEIEAFLTRYLLIRICARFEEFIKNALVRRASVTKDPFVESIVRSVAPRLVRSLLTSELKGLLRNIGEEYKATFDANLTDPLAETYYNNLVTSRHDTAHGPASTVTFGDLEAFYQKALVVLEAFEKALSSSK